MSNESTQYKPGDRVTVTIEDAVFEKNNAGRVFVRVDRTPEISDSGVYASFPLGDPAVIVDLIVPAEWPPRPGDLWRDKHGELWFIHKNPYGSQPEPPRLLGRTTGGARWTDDMDALVEDNAPLTLVHREDVK